MQREVTTFVIGAGASAEVGLPVGEKLKEIIAKEAYFEFEYGQFSKGNYDLFETLKQMAAQKLADDRNGVNVYLGSARAIRANMPLSISIDNFLDSRKNEIGTVDVGKLFITYSILLAEKSSKIMNRRDAQSVNDSILFDEIVDTWYVKLFRIITEQAQFEEIPQLLGNINFVVFNYDRCIEHFLHGALMQYYSRSEQEVSEALKYLRVFRPYGSVGPLPWQDRRGLPFGQSVMHQRLIDVSEGIKIFTEQIEENDGDISAIHDAIAVSDTIVFLGFGYHHQNLRLIRPKSGSFASKVIGTASGISGSDISKIRASIAQWFDGIPHEVEFTFEEKMYCDEFFRHYWRTLARFH